MKDRDPYHSALNALAGFAAAGRFGWGEPLVATALAEELRLSPTPVREALARLAGEGVLEHRPGRGYFAPSPTASDIADLYELHRRLTHWALDVAPATAARLVQEPSPPDLRLEILYATIAASAGADILTRAHRRVMLQLRPVRAVEAVVRPPEVEQIARQEALLAAGRTADLRVEVDVYHEGRRAAASAVFAVMRRSGQSIERI
ncbi:MAG: GntR family transcriptional regulator [Phenylobacterium sp.]|nr:GntR family transcriptional regulator [Phenylobacterium sp.]